MRPLAWLLLLALLGTTALVGPGRDYSAYAVWWLTNSEPPELALRGPAGPVRGTVEVPLEARPSGRVDLLAADVDGRELASEPLPSAGSGQALRIDTTSLSDGEHLLSVQAQDRSLRHNAASASLRLSSDNTPPSFEIRSTPDNVPQGHTVVVHVHSNEPAEAQVRLDSAPLHLFPAGADYWAVLGVDSDEKPGPRELAVDGRDRVGNPGHAEGQLAVVPYKFTEDSIQVPESLVPLLSPAVRAAEDERLLPVYQRDNGPPLWKGPFLLPVIGPISTEFGEVRSYNGRPFEGHHNGTDFQAGQGAPVQAPARARVAFRDQVRLRGNILILDHGGGVYTTYAHLSEWLAEPGQEVEPGQPVARVGSTGLSTGPHLHWELWINGKSVDPVEWTQREVP